MKIFIDDLIHIDYEGMYSIMMAKDSDSIEKLDEIAESIDLNILAREYIRGMKSHCYKVPIEKRQQAIKKGANSCNYLDLLLLCYPEMWYYEELVEKTGEMFQTREALRELQEATNLKIVPEELWDDYERWLGEWEVREEFGTLRAHLDRKHSRVVETGLDPLYLIRNIGPILLAESTINPRSQLLIRFPNDHGLGILTYPLDEQDERYYWAVKIDWKDSEWSINKDSLRNHRYGRLEVDRIQEIMRKLMEIEREGLWALSEEEYDFIWKMRNRELEDLIF